MKKGFLKDMLQDIYVSIMHKCVANMLCNDFKFSNLYIRTFVVSYPSWNRLLKAKNSGDRKLPIWNCGGQIV